MEEKIIIWLQSNGNVFFDVFFQAISYLASWLGAVCLFLIIFLFVNKKFGLIFCGGYLLTVLFNYGLKELINKPRPYVTNPEIINKLTTVGKSMPSGHSVSCIFMVLTIIFLLYTLCANGKFTKFKKKGVKIPIIASLIVFALLVAISRMYLGQHYLTDILAGFAVGTIGFVITYFVYKKIVKKHAKC